MKNWQEEKVIRRMQNEFNLTRGKAKWKYLWTPLIQTQTVVTPDDAL